MKRKPIFKFTSMVLALCLLSLSIVGCGESQSTNRNSSDSKYTHRVIILTDPHYSYEETAAELRAAYPECVPSAVTGNTFGYTQAEKIQTIITDIDNFNERESIEAVFVLGDVSTDDYGYRKYPENYVAKFKKDFVDQLSYPCHVIPGNHDSYSNGDWKKAMGTDRQYSVKIGDAAFIMLDTFEAKPTTSYSGSEYIGIDVDFLKKEIAKYPTETIFLCTHYYESNDASPNYELSKLMKENDRIVCLFRGHTHQNSALMSTELNDRYVFDAGCYAYDLNADANGKHDYNAFNEDYAWGYQVLEWNDTEVHTYHVKPPRQYTASNGTVDYVGCIEDEYTIQIGDK